MMKEHRRPLSTHLIHSLINSKLYNVLPLETNGAQALIVGQMIIYINHNTTKVFFTFLLKKDSILLKENRTRLHSEQHFQI